MVSSEVLKLLDAGGIVAVEIDDVPELRRMGYKCRIVDGRDPGSRVREEDDYAQAVSPAYFKTMKDKSGWS